MRYKAQGYADYNEYSIHRIQDVVLHTGYLIFKDNKNKT